MPSITMTVNGKTVSGDVEGRTLLVQFLRENLRLTGTHVGCDTSQCGACVVLMNGESVKACTVRTAFMVSSIWLPASATRSWL